MAFKDKDSRFNMGKFQGVKAFFNIKVSVDDEQSFDGQKQTTLSIFARQKVEIQYPLLWQCLLIPINKEINKKGHPLIIYIVMEANSKK